jgi:predicted O-methyltransferase YrrM
VARGPAVRTMTAKVDIRMTMRTGGSRFVPNKGDLIYLLCRGMRATRVVEFATSVGMSTLYFAAAMRDNGGGRVIGSELVPAKVAAAKHNLSEAGLAAYAEIREGDARHTLRDLGVRWISP